MNDLDVAIVKKREEKKKRQHTTLASGCYVNSELILFQRQRINDRFSIMLPNSFRGMPEEVAQIKYPSVFRPQLIVTNQNLSVNIGFYIFSEQSKGFAVEEVINHMINALSRQHSDIQFYENKKLSKIEVNWFSFKSDTMDGEIYNIIAAVLFNQTLLQVNFNCPFLEKMEWKPVILKVLESIKDERSGEEG